MTGFDHFTRQPDSTHCVVYGNGAGELLVSYWPSESIAHNELRSIQRLADVDEFDPNPVVESLAELDAIEGQ